MPDQRQSTIDYTGGEQYGTGEGGLGSSNRATLQKHFPTSVINPDAASGGSGVVALVDGGTSSNKGMRSVLGGVESPGVGGAVAADSIQEKMASAATTAAGHGINNVTLAFNTNLEAATGETAFGEAPAYGRSNDGTDALGALVVSPFVDGADEVAKKDTLASKLLTSVVVAADAYGFTDDVNLNHGTNEANASGQALLPESSTGSKTAGQTPKTSVDNQKRHLLKGLPKENDLSDSSTAFAFDGKVSRNFILSDDATFATDKAGSSEISLNREDQASHDSDLPMGTDPSIDKTTYDTDVLQASLIAGDAYGFTDPVNMSFSTNEAAATGNTTFGVAPLLGRSATDSDSPQDPKTSRETHTEYMSANLAAAEAHAFDAEVKLDFDTNKAAATGNTAFGVSPALGRSAANSEVRSAADREIDGTEMNSIINATVTAANAHAFDQDVTLQFANKQNNAAATDTGNLGITTSAADSKTAGANWTSPDNPIAQHTAASYKANVAGATVSSADAYKFDSDVNLNMQTNKDAATGATPFAASPGLGRSSATSHTDGDSVEAEALAIKDALLSNTLSSGDAYKFDTSVNLDHDINSAAATGNTVFGSSAGQYGRSSATSDSLPAPGDTPGPWYGASALAHNSGLTTNTIQADDAFGFNSNVSLNFGTNETVDGGLVDASLGKSSDDSASAYLEDGLWNTSKEQLKSALLEGTVEGSPYFDGAVQRSHTTNKEAATGNTPFGVSPALGRSSETSHVPADPEIHAATLRTRLKDSVPAVDAFGFDEDVSLDMATNKAAATGETAFGPAPALGRSSDNSDVPQAPEVNGLDHLPIVTKGTVPGASAYKFPEGVTLDPVANQENAETLGKTMSAGAVSAENPLGYGFGRSGPESTIAGNFPKTSPAEFQDLVLNGLVKDPDGTEVGGYKFNKFSRGYQGAPNIGGGDVKIGGGGKPGNEFGPNLNSPGEENKFDFTKIAPPTDFNKDSSTISQNVIPPAATSEIVKTMTLGDYLLGRSTDKPLVPPYLGDEEQNAMAHTISEVNQALFDPGPEPTISATVEVIKPEGTS